MFEKEVIEASWQVRPEINKAYRMKESMVVQKLLNLATLPEEKAMAIEARASRLVELVRTNTKNRIGIDTFLTEYSLSSDEGIALMCLAEALLRVPDNDTVDLLIKDKLMTPDWKSHKGQSTSIFVNAATWALMLTGKILTPSKTPDYQKSISGFFARTSEGIVKSAIKKAMYILSRQFVMASTISDALTKAQKMEAQGYRFSYDMLGEAAITAKDADRYHNAYKNAIHAIGASVKKDATLYERPNISIKLSALHPRYQEGQHARVLKELVPKLLELALLASQYGIGLTIDAEESERLELSLDIIEQVVRTPALKDWDGFGMAVQSYQKRAPYVLDWVAELARSTGHRIMVRLIKGAYWDSEIKKAQMQGLTDYPVFTRKAYTDVSFQACVNKIFKLTDAIYPQFATHNAYSVAMVLELAGSSRDFEFQCLYGMGDALYQQIVPENREGIACRIYAPIGSYEELLPYLVRRLLENGANSSFVNRIVDEKTNISELVESPLNKATNYLNESSRNIPLPEAIFPNRKNSLGFDFTDRAQRTAFIQNLTHFMNKTWESTPLIANHVSSKPELPIFSPQQVEKIVGYVHETSNDEIELALVQAEKAFVTWSQTSVVERALCLERAADAMENNVCELLAILTMEAGKTCLDAIAEVREAVDFCRYYAEQAKKLMGEPHTLVGYTGEKNELSLHARGTILCISPWNFPLAIFMGQIVASLVTGHCVIAKPAEQTPLIAAFATRLLYEAGIPQGVLQLLPGKGEVVAAALVADRRIHGVLFTGSTETARIINQTLAQRKGEIIPLIAETGGQNAMIVDSSALLEQVVIDAITSAFGSSGQRCSALRVLYIQEEVYERTIELLTGAMAELVIGDPIFLNTDIGPVIDKDALLMLQQHVKALKSANKVIYQCSLEEHCDSGYFMHPTLIALDSMEELAREVFGPILHVIRYKRADLDKVIAEINASQFGLTLGIHSRINETIQYIHAHVRAGNCYVNRNMTGAVVGLQPFGGERLSGTGPKAGGPHYLSRLCIERTLTVDTTAAGGNASLLALG